MKYIITESQKQTISDKIYKYIDNLLPSNMYVNYFDDTEEVNFPEKISHIDSIAFYNDDYDRQFTIYLENYWMDNQFGMARKKESPILSIDEPDIKNQLDGLFASHWREPFLKWFEHNYGYELTYGIKIKTISGGC
jgi:hypothetical protein